ncbi:urease accessory protein UreD [Actinoallomurus sp. NBC_01490]|jgi:urease accessory protein|uniref:urease accessory protein UreD n=1 Tax=Actinoallomurus sp. NBC_01490 TaxID=2903557 RepID=UPI002E363B80|nr:urease accessory protein UreD [Actinoallomurus sp. NBC_01490]
MTAHTLTTTPTRRPPGLYADVRDRPHSLRGTARITAIAEAGATRLSDLHGDGPLDPRRLRPRGAQARVCVVGAMNAPHNGDHLRIEVTVGPGADLRVTSATATVALPSPTPAPATLELFFSIAESARLHWLPKPLISAAGSDLHQETRIDLAPTARLLLSEHQILGRAHETTGRLTNRLTVQRCGRTLLDQRTAYGPGAPCWDGPAVLADYRTIGQLLLIDPTIQHPSEARLLDDDPARGHAVITPLPGPGRLLTAVAPDAAALRRHLYLGLENQTGESR